jgi:hypothetical protein
MESHPDKFVDRKFRLLFEDAVTFMDHAETTRRANKQWIPVEGAYARASILNSAMMLEAAANALIAALDLPKAYFKDIERMSVLSKFEYYLQTVQPGTRMDRGSPAAQRAEELASTLRNLIVHPKRFTSEWTTQEERTYRADLGETQFLHLPHSFVVLKHEHALTALKAAMSFLNHFFRELCRHPDCQVRALLTSDREYPLPENVSTAHDPRWIEWHDRWGIDVDFLIDVRFVKEAEARFHDHLKNQLTRQEADEDRPS